MKNRNPAQLSLLEQQKLHDPRLSDRDAVRAICERLLASVDARPPVNVGLIASLRGIVRIEPRPQAFAGMLVHGQLGMVAHVRASDSPVRVRFTVLHEAGHTLLPGYAEAPQFRCKRPQTWEEQLCDLAAAELLMPRRFFVADLAAEGFGVTATENLSAHYQASIEATAIRAVDLWPDDALLLVLKQSHKPAESGKECDVPAKLRLAWSHAKGDWPHLRRYKSVDDDSPFARAFSGEVIDENGDLDGLASDDAGRVRISAKRFGCDGRVVALVRRAEALRADQANAR
jgi:hypothetical protein